MKPLLFLHASARSHEDELRAANLVATPHARRAHVLVARGRAGATWLAMMRRACPRATRLYICEEADGPEQLADVVATARPARLLVVPVTAETLAAAVAAAASGSTAQADSTELVPTATFLRRLRQEEERARRYRRPLALCVFDIDDLRRVNDEHGRAAGDQLLRQCAALLGSGARAVDVVGLVASGTFALLLPETDLGAAHGTGERLRANLAALKVGGVRISVSAGIAAAPRRILARATTALANAKRRGNCSVVDAGEDR